MESKRGQKKGTRGAREVERSSLKRREERKKGNFKRKA